MDVEYDDECTIVCGGTCYKVWGHLQSVGIQSVAQSGKVANGNGMEWNE